MATFIKAGFWEKLCKPCNGYKGWLNLDEFIQSFIPKPTYKVYTALLTQSGGYNILMTASDAQIPFILGVTYIISANDGNADFTNIGAPNNNVGTYFIATGTIPNSWGDGGYAECDYNEGAPVVTVLENTIGDIWFTYNSDGNYGVNSNGLFIFGNTALFIGNAVVSTMSQNVIFSTPALDSFAIILSSGNLIDQTLTNGVLSSTPIEIRVYN